MEHRPLGGSAIDVSVLSLGSWRTYERIPRERGLEVMLAAREVGIDFLDDARYDDETGSAPLPTGYSEVVFGELFRATGWPRDEVVIANKLWYEFWPEQSAEQELDASLGRMGLDYVDLIYATWPPESLAAEEVVDGIAGLLSSGRARAWGVVNWPPALLLEATRIAGGRGVPAPCAAQVPYSLVSRSWVEGPDAAVLADVGAAVVASAVLASGALTGKYVHPEAEGRIAGRLDDTSLRQALALGRELGPLAERHGTMPAALAIAFALAGERVASVLFGATGGEQVRENARALQVDPGVVAELRALGSES
jgi:aryl-alcohol dehydrogenase-like predicted oxidoreductase